MISPQKFLLLCTLTNSPKKIHPSHDFSPIVRLNPPPPCSRRYKRFEKTKYRFFSLFVWSFKLSPLEVWYLNAPSPCYLIFLPLFPPLPLPTNEISHIPLMAKDFFVSCPYCFPSQKIDSLPLSSEKNPKLIFYLATGQVIPAREQPLFSPFFAEIEIVSKPCTFLQI